MSEVIILSDSNESNLSIELTNELKNKKQKSRCNNSDSDDFEFPEIQFNYVASQHKVSYQTNDELFTASKNTKQTNVETYCVLGSSNSSENSEEDDKNAGKKKKSKVTTKKNKNQLTEKGLKKQEQLREKALKVIAAKRLKNLKPGECLKFIEVVIDKSIENYAFATNIVNSLLDVNIKYSIDTGLISNSIAWKRIIETSYVNETNEICTTTNTEVVNQILLIWNWDETVTKVADGSFYDSIVNVKTSLPDYKMILVIFGIEDYFIHKNQKGNTGKNKAKSKAASSNNKFKDFPEISRRKLETCLNEIQIIAECNTRLINSTQDLALMVYQCTKAIAEIPYKLEKNQNLKNKFDWYVMGDNRNCVRVDKDGNGLKRLWQQQLCQFNLSSLEIAEAICSVYPSPADLIEAYMNCTDDEGLNLLKDIPIRRAAGPLTAVRKVGPELSKKVYLMFTSRDGENILS